jgi:AcrR family transcriptional regulator
MTRPSGPPEPAYELPPVVAEARERILRTAYELFRHHGITAVGVDRIVAEAGVAKTTLYRHFRSKDELVLAVLERHEQLWLGWLEAEVALRGTTPVERLLAVFDAFEEWFRQGDYRGCLFLNTLLEAHDQPSVAEAAEERLAAVRVFLRTLAEPAGFDDPDELARQVQLLMFGSIMASMNGDREAAQRARALARSVLGGQRART